MPTSIQVPYEVLIRYRKGVLSGANVGWSLLITDDDGTQREVPQGIDPIDIGQGKGFPLADILDKIHVDALIAVAAKDVELSAKEAAIATAESEKAALAAAKDAEIAAENAVALAAKALAAKNAEVAAAEKDDPGRVAKEAEAAQLANAVSAKDAELVALRLPDKRAKIQAEIDRLQAELVAASALKPE